MRNNLFMVTMALLGAVIVICILLPIINILLGVNSSLFWETLKDSEVIQCISVTFRNALYATIFGLICGVPLAYVLARKNFWGKEVIEAIVDLPVIIPHSAAGIALLGVFGKKFFAGKVFDSLGIGFVGTEWGIALAMFFVSIPFLINGAKEGFKMVEVRLEHVAMTLGARPRKAFFDVTLPLAFRSILAGLIMMWARGISEFGAVVILAYHPMVASVKIFERFESYGLRYAKPIAVLLIIVCLFIFISLRLIVRKKT